MRITTRLQRAALLAALLAPAPVAGSAWAQVPAAPSEQGAREIVEAMRAWLGRQTADALDWSALGLRVVADGETYRLELPFGGSYLENALKMGEGAASAVVKPLEGGRWSIVSFSLPSKLQAEVRGSKDAAPSVMDVSIESQQTTGTYDPSLTTPSTFLTEASGYTTAMRGPNGEQTSRIGKLKARSEWLPSGPGRVTIQGDSALEGYVSISPLPGGEQAKVTIGRLGGETRIENFNVDGLSTLLRTAFEIGAKVKAESAGNAGDSKGKGAAPSGEEQKALATRLLVQLFGMIDGMQTDYSYDDICVEGGTMFSGSLRRFGMGLGFGAPGGKVEIKLRLALEGLESPMIPPGPWVEFIPHKLTLTPRVGGVPKEAVLALLQRAIDTEGQEMADAGFALLADHPVALAIDDLLMDIGPLRLKGAGAVDVSGPDEYSAKAELRATGLDALIRRANAVPELKIAAPVLIFLKGIARQDGNESVWAISYVDRKMVVNDTDLSGLMPVK